MENKKEFVLGEVTFIEDAGSNGQNRLGKYLCFCGKEFITVKVRIKRGDTRSCGCYQEYIMNSNPNTKHESCYTPLYNSWGRMIQRCTNPKDPKYLYYGGRGITVCEEWKTDFRVFQKWGLENGYVEGLSLDRADVNGNYEPSNCRWGDGFQQAQNRRKSCKSKNKYKSVLKTKFGKWSVSITCRRIRYSLGNYELETSAALAYNIMAKKYHKEYAHINDINITVETPESFIKEAQILFKQLAEKTCEQDAMALLKMFLIHGIIDIGYTDKTGSR